MGDCLVHDVGEAASVHIMHGERLHAELAEVGALPLVEVPDADEDHMLRANRGHRAVEGEQARVAVAEQVRHRHSVHIPRRARGGRVDVPVSVNPEQAERLTTAPHGARSPCNRASPQRVVAAQHHGKAPRTHGCFHAVRQVRAHARNHIQEVHPSRFRRKRAAIGDDEVALVADGVAESEQRLTNARGADSVRTHVDAAAAGAEIEGYANEVDLGHDGTRTGRVPKAPLWERGSQATIHATSCTARA